MTLQVSPNSYSTSALHSGLSLIFIIKALIILNSMKNITNFAVQ